MTRFPARCLLVLALCALLCAGGAASAAGREMVLVASGGVDLDPLSRTELRRLFLGVPVEQGSRPLVAVTNRSDELLYEVFLQKVVFMSARTYERQLVSRVLHQGGRRLAEIDSSEEVGRTLRERPGAVTYMWKTDAEADPQVQIIQTLGQGAPR